MDLAYIYIAHKKLLVTCFCEYYRLESWYMNKQMKYDTDILQDYTPQHLV